MADHAAAGSAYLTGGALGEWPGHRRVRPPARPL